MGNFCKYCGNPIQEGGVCECQSSKIEAPSAEHQEQMESNNGAINSSINESTNHQFAKIDQALVKSTLSTIKDLSLSYFIKPVSTLEEALVETNKLPQFLIGIIYSVILFLCLTIRLSSFVDSLGNLLLITIALVLIKAIYAGMLYLFAKKLGYAFKSILALFCLSTLPEIAGLLIVLILSYIFASSYMLLIVMLIMLYVVAISSELITFLVIFKEDRDKCFWIFILCSFVVTLIQGFVIKQAIMSAVQSAMNSMGSIIGTLF